MYVAHSPLFAQTAQLELRRVSIDFSRKGGGRRFFASQPTISLRETSYSLPCQDIRQVRFFYSFV